MEKPLNSLLTHQIIRPSIMKMNNPKVIIVKGMVKITRRGFKRKLKKVRTSATGIAVKKLFIFAPGKSLALSQMEAVIIKRRKR
jgi:hypothetical protein